MKPETMLFATSHEWVHIDNDIATVGISDYAQTQLGDLTFVELPAVGTQVTAGSELGSVESVKAASEIYAPVSGEIIEVNTELESTPECVNQDAFGTGWMVKIKLTEKPVNLLDLAAYTALCAEEAH
ncbi:glycine cleavage system protein GcvH [Desulfovibrionales bacterium]